MRALVVVAVLLCVLFADAARRPPRQNKLRRTPPKPRTNNARRQKTQAPPSLQSIQQKICGSEGDCVNVKCPVGGQYLVEGLNLHDMENGESITDVIDRLPKWFGPKRPLECKFNDRALEGDVPLAHYGVDIGNTVTCQTVSAGGEEL
eukprot:TRINITY_DN2018_c0_g1_i1.p2 TRINITY_DN2018_c0_g1~~TRINITY_DN2018_c0_g1_i1.p2  ORF type:complete len:148 (+),score=42.57 TRINITY_DN2018_c0_g1_i1:73-516(+)